MGFYDWDRMTPEEITGMYSRKVALGENIVVARVEVAEGSVTQEHSHNNEEVVMVLEGAWRFHLPARDVTLRAN